MLNKIRANGVVLKSVRLVGDVGLNHHSAMEAHGLGGRDVGPVTHPKPKLLHMAVVRIKWKRSV